MSKKKPPWNEGPNSGSYITKYLLWKHLRNVQFSVLGIRNKVGHLNTAGFLLSRILSERNIVINWIFFELKTF